MKELPEPEHHPELPASTGEPFESPKAQPQPGETQNDLAMRMLYEEQVRLRAELAKLKEKGEEEDDEEQEDGEKEEKKPPLKQRVRAWIRTHPVATVLILIGVLLFIIGVIWLIHYLNSYTDTDDAYVDGHTILSAHASADMLPRFTWRTRRVCTKGSCLRYSIRATTRSQRSAPQRATRRPRRARELRLPTFRLLRRMFRPT